MGVEQNEYWIRTDAGKVVGPVSRASLERMAQQPNFGVRCQLSRDGVSFAAPALFAELRALFGGLEVPTGEPVAAPAGSPLAALIPAGELAGGTALRLHALLGVSNLSGLLRLVDEAGGVFELFYKKGTPERATASERELGLVAWLVRQGRLSEEAAARVEASGGDPVGALFALGLLQPADAFQLLGRHGASVIARALLVEKGSFTWDPEAKLPGGTFPLGEKWALLLDAGRRVDGQAVLRRLGDRLDRPVMRAGDTIVPVEALGLTPQETRTVAAFDGSRSLAMIAAASPAESEQILRTGWLLAEIGVASFAAVQLPRPAMFAPAPEPEPEPQPEPEPEPKRYTPRAMEVEAPRLAPAGPARQAIAAANNAVRAAAPHQRYPSDAAGIQAFLEGLEGKDHFQVLGLPRSATTPLVKQAYFQRAKAFHPDTSGTAEPGVLAAKEAITARLNEAYAVLSDDGRRADYLMALTAGPAAAEVDVANLIAAEQSFQRASNLTKTRRYQEALVELERAIALNREEGEFYAWRAYVRFTLALDKPAGRGEAFADIDAALQLNPNCAVAYLFAGRIATVLGDAAGAIKYYKRCLGLDGGNVEAQRELRLLESRLSK